MHRSLGIVGVVLNFALLLAGCSGSDKVTFGPAPQPSSQTPSEGNAPIAPSQDDTNSGTPSEPGSGGDDAGTSTADDASTTPGATPDAGQAAPVVINGCTPDAFEDRSASGAPRDIDAPSFGPPRPFSTPCMRIAKGQEVTWRGRFSTYPLEPHGGKTPSPIPTLSTGREVVVTFTSPGTYGFVSPADPDVMLGAIEVKPAN